MKIPKTDFYNLSQALQGVLIQKAIAEWNRTHEPAQPRPILLQIQAGYAESPSWMMVQALEFYPEAITVEKLRRRAVWSAPRTIAALLEMLTLAQWLKRDGETYQLTEIGLALMQERQAQISAWLGCIQPLPEDDLARLENYLQQAMQLSLQSSHDSWCLEHSLNRAPASDAPILARISAHCSDFNAFRDDAHMAAFQEYSIPAYIWECLTLIWQKTAHTPEQVFEQIYYRGYSQGELVDAFDELEARKWIELQGQEYQLTDSGFNIREAAEERTDEIFYGPWADFSEAELGDFEQLILAAQA